MLFKRIFWVLMFVPMITNGQISLEQCYRDAYINHPSYDNIRLFLEMGELEKQNSGVSNMPQATLKANVSWQSDVTSVDLPNAGIVLPELARDWYKLYIDVTQTIYDGGLSQSKKALATASMEKNVQQQKVNLYAVKGSVNLAYFSVLQIQKQTDMLKLKLQVLQDQITLVKSAVDNGAVNRNELNNIKAEWLVLNQQIIELESRRKSALDKLSLITGNNFSAQTTLLLPMDPFGDSSFLKVLRPELDLLDAQKEQLETQKELLKNGRKPKVFGYGQAGYGRPGLNMLNDSFDDWYVIGLGMQWKIYDWKETSRKKELLELQKEMTENQRDQFMYQLELLTSSKWHEIEKLKQIILSDDELLALRKELADNSASQFKNGVITSADYIRDLNNYYVAMLTKEQHQVTLIKARYEFLTLTGTDKEKGFSHENQKK